MRERARVLTRNHVGRSVAVLVLHAHVRPATQQHGQRVVRTSHASTAAGASIVNVIIVLLIVRVTGAACARPPEPGRLRCLAAVTQHLEQWRAAVSVAGVYVRAG